MKKTWLFALIILIILSACKISQPKATVKLQQAVLNNEPSNVEKFINKGALINYKEAKRGWSPLLYACQGGYLQVAKVLLRNGADPNQQSELDKVTPIERAASNGYFEIVKLLIENGADVDQQNSKHRATALMFASLNGHSEVVDLLVDNGALLDVRGTRGESALFLAVSAERKEVVQKLLAYGANKDRPDIFGMTCLQKAIDLQNEDLISLLKEK